jgi:hypothetical protein
MTALSRVLIAAIVLLAFPAAALACPVCGLAGTGDNSDAYVEMSVMLSVVPLGMIGGVAFWLFRRSKRVTSRPE